MKEGTVSATIAISSPRLSSAQATGRPAPMRLTRRGRAVLAALVTLLVAFAAALALWMGTSSAEATTQPQGVPVTYVDVYAGDSLWGIAEQVAPQADPRDTIATLMEFNGLETATVQPGQRIAIPANL